MNDRNASYFEAFNYCVSVQISKKESRKLDLGMLPASQTTFLFRQTWDFKC